MNVETRKRLAIARERKYYKLSGELESIRWMVRDIASTRCNNTVFKHLESALFLAEDQIRRDYDRYVKRIHTMDNREEVKQLQTALNRERIKREELQAKVDEATTSSGLFIKFCRDKLGV